MDPKEAEDEHLIELRKANKDGEVEEVLSKRQASRKLKMLWHSRRVPYVISATITRKYIFLCITSHCLKGMKKISQQIKSSTSKYLICIQLISINVLLTFY